jgi:ribosome-binding factor A
MGRRPTAAGREPSQRQLRVGEALRHVLSELLRRGVGHNPLLADAQLTVSEVRVSPDLRHAVVFVTELGGELRPQLRAALEQAAPLLRGEASRQTHLKYAPNLSFEADTSFAEAARIEALIARERATVGDRGENDDGVS